MGAPIITTAAEKAAPPPPPSLSGKMGADFAMGGSAAVVAKSGAAPVERVKLLLQNQGEMLKRGHLARPYKGIGDCALRVLKEEGLLSFWRGNQANVIRYFPTQRDQGRRRRGEMGASIITTAAEKAAPPPRLSGKMATDFAMGGFAVVVAKSGAAPVERVKLLLQNQGEMLKRGHLTRPYKGIGDCALWVLKEEGLLSFWRGNQANVIRYFPTQAFNFAFKGYFQSLFGRSKEKDGYAKWLVGNVASGSAAGATTSLFLYHLDYARTRLATDAIESQASSQHQFKGLSDVYKKTLSSDGFAGLYRGFGVSIIGITLYRGLYFGIYDSLKPIVLVGPLEGKFLASFLLGWSVTTISGLCAYPFDTLRRRMMLTSGQPSKYRNGVHALKQIVRTEGVSVLFRGVAANMLSGMAGAGVLAGYDQLHRIASRLGYGYEHQLKKGALK